jgi:hypothetical protein
MLNMSSVIRFGKYRGTSISYLYKTNPQYLAWILDNTILLDGLSKEDKKKIRGRGNNKYMVVYGNGFSNGG